MQSRSPSSPTLIPIHSLQAVTDTIRPMPMPIELGRVDQVRDRLGRAWRDLRISVTDRCNFRCGYCMPREVFDKHHAFLPHQALLRFEEITRVAKLALSLGVTTLRITGGEPLLRKDLAQLIAQLSSLRTLDGTPPDIALTTNGSLLRRKAQQLKEAGLNRVTVSLDALEPAQFARMSDSQVDVADVLSGIDAAQAAGLGPVKVNMVVQRGVNDDQIVPMARHFRGSDVELRFIEFMDVGQTNAWDLRQVLPSQSVRERLHQHWPLARSMAQRQGETAEKWRYEDGAGQIGFISSVTTPFCGDCSRLRLSTDGRLYTCLFGHTGHDLRAILRQGEDDATIRARMAALWQSREDRYSELRAHIKPTSAKPKGRVEMSFIGG